MKNTVETIYKIQMAAIKVYEANEAYRTAENAHRQVEYDWTHKDTENNDLWMRLLEDSRTKEGLLKKAVNNFFKAVGEPTKKWDLGLQAIYDFNDYLDNHSGFYYKSPVPEFNIYNCKIRRY